MMKKTVVILLMTSLLASPILTARTSPESSIVPGGVVNIALDIPVSTHSVPPKVYFQNNRVLVFEHEKQYHALVGLPLSLKPNVYSLSYADNQGVEHHKKFTVHSKQYATSRITIKNENMVNPDEATQAIIAKDQQKISAATKDFSSITPSLYMFANPVTGIPTTSFGSKRIINNHPKNPHSGMDIAAKTGTIVHAGLEGKVVLADQFYYSGNMVALDHGQGLISMYAHLSRISAQVGDYVKTGDVIGEVGSTGRVTGPHLHWTVKLNNTAVDPALFLDKPRKNA